MTTLPLLDVQNLTVRLAPPGAAAFNAVRNVSFTLGQGEVFCLVGESGCGKSMTALAVLRLLPGIGSIASGRILFEEHDLTALPETALNTVRGRRVGMIFQEPMTSLNPVLRVGDQVAEVLVRHKKISSRDALRTTAELFRAVGIPEPEARLRDYPHRLSGGLRQRVMIAIAMACEPALLIADEPTTALDVTVQRQILTLLRKQAALRGMGMLLITHDLGVVADTASQVGVMYAGQLVEKAPAEDLFREPLHPYTQGLIASAPAFSDDRKKRLYTIPGTVPPPWDIPAGCPFRPRCPHASERCLSEPPATLHQSGTGRGFREVRCHLHTR